MRWETDGLRLCLGATLLASVSQVAAASLILPTRTGEATPVGKVWWPQGLFIYLSIVCEYCCLFLQETPVCVCRLLLLSKLCLPSEVAMPSVIILNTSNEQYFLPAERTETMEQLVQFITGVLNGSVQV